MQPPARQIRITITIPPRILRLALAPVMLYRRLRHGRPYRRIPLTRNKHALVDPEDYPALARHRWCAAAKGRTFYAVRSTPRGQILMHRSITNAPAHLVVDHINHNGLDNRKSNLRLCTKSRNATNQRIRKGGSSRYKGVCWHKRDKKWHARLHHRGKTHHLGSFTNEKDAARAYDKAARKHHKSYATLNFPHKPPPIPVTTAHAAVPPPI